MTPLLADTPDRCWAWESTAGLLLKMKVVDMIWVQFLPCSVVVLRSHEHFEFDGLGTRIRLKLLGKDEADIRHKLR